jgi:hypothetical protein
MMKQLLTSTDAFSRPAPLDANARVYLVEDSLNDSEARREARQELCEPILFTPRWWKAPQQELQGCSPRKA